LLLAATIVLPRLLAPLLSRRAVLRNDLVILGELDERGSAAVLRLRDGER
jgi:hypothetical protein